MKIGIDLDGVVNDWDSFVKTYIEDYLSCKVDYKKYIHTENMSEEDKDMYIRGFCAYIDWYLYEFISEESLYELLTYIQNSGHEVFIITSRKNGSEHFKYLKKGIEKLTLEEAYELGVKEENVFFTEYKDIVCKNLGIDVMIDDYIGNYNLLTASGIKTYLMTQEHNVDYEVENRVNSLYEFFKEIGVL